MQTPENSNPDADNDRPPRLDQYNRFALVMAAIVGVMSGVLGIASGNLFYLIIAGGIFYTVYREFNRR